MKIEAVDFYYLSMPEVRDIGDGSQDALLVRVVMDDGTVGYGECEAAPLPSIAAWCCPMSHSACKPVRDAVLGRRVESPADIARIGADVRAWSLDLLQAAHTLSGIDIALWDALGRNRGAPVHSLLGQLRPEPKMAYASVLFGDDPQQTLEKARGIARSPIRAAKFGWGPYGRGSVAADAEHVHAAREGLGPDRILLVDAGTVFGTDVEAAAARLPALEAARATWLEEPFVSHGLAAYAALARRSALVRMAGGEGCHDPLQGVAMIDHAGLGFVQIDTGRIGGITPAAEVAAHAAGRGVRYVNHTFTTHLALSASLQPYAGSAADDLCEYPFEPSALAAGFTTTKIDIDSAGRVRVPDTPGLGVVPDLDAIRPYLVEVEMKIGGQALFRSPTL